jgi:hypothetical protein
VFTPIFVKLWPLELVYFYVHIILLLILCSGQGRNIPITNEKELRLAVDKTYEGKKRTGERWEEKTEERRKTRNMFCSEIL